jgi:hypothetical protein
MVLMHSDENYLLASAMNGVVSFSPFLCPHLFARSVMLPQNIGEFIFWLLMVLLDA